MNRIRDHRDRLRWLGVAAVLGSLVSIGFVQPRAVLELVLLLAGVLWFLLRPTVRRASRARQRTSARFARG